MRKAAETLPLRSNGVREDLADVNPNDCSLREREKTDETSQKPQKKAAVTAGEKHPSHAGQGSGTSDGSDEKQFSPPNFVYKRHRDCGRDQIRYTNRDRLHIAGD